MGVLDISGRGVVGGEGLPLQKAAGGWTNNRHTLGLQSYQYPYHLCDRHLFCYFVLFDPRDLLDLKGTAGRGREPPEYQT